MTVCANCGEEIRESGGGWRHLLTLNLYCHPEQLAASYSVMRNDPGAKAAPLTEEQA